MRDETVVVTGSSGFVGRHLVTRLQEEGADVIPFDIIDGRDITRWPDFEKIAKAEVVYHLAAKTFVPSAQEDPRATYEVNILGTINALEFARRRGARLVFASSYVYGNPEYLPIDEKHPIQPTNPYARSKVLGEMLCRAYNEDYGLPCVILRPFNIFGEGQDERFLIPEIINQLRTGRSVTLKDLKPKRDFLYVGDAVDAYVKAGEYDLTDFEIFNIGYGSSRCVEDIATKLIQLSKRDVPLESLASRRKGEISDTVADIKKARELLKWHPAVDIDDALRQVLEGI
jgi:UDP-glucose 4-epimerase